MIVSSVGPALYLTWFPESEEGFGEVHVVTFLVLTFMGLALWIASMGLILVQYFHRPG